MLFEKFLVRKMIWKGARRFAQVGVGFAVLKLTQDFGVKITPEQEAAIVASVTGALESGINAAKQSSPKYFGWL